MLAFVIGLGHRCSRPGNPLQIGLGWIQSASVLLNLTTSVRTFRIQVFLPAVDHIRFCFWLFSSGVNGFAIFCAGAKRMPGENPDWEPC